MLSIYLWGLLACAIVILLTTLYDVFFKRYDQVFDTASIIIAVFFLSISWIGVLVILIMHISANTGFPEWVNNLLDKEWFTIKSRRH